MIEEPYQGMGLAGQRASHATGSGRHNRQNRALKFKRGIKDIAHRVVPPQVVIAQAIALFPNFLTLIGGTIRIDSGKKSGGIPAWKKVVRYIGPASNTPLLRVPGSRQRDGLRPR